MSSPAASGARPAPRSVGFVGLGQMGMPMSRHLLDAGFAVAGYDIDAARTTELARAGGIPADTPRAVSEAAEVVVTSLPSPEALTAVLEGDDGLLAAGRERLVVVETSTFDLTTKEAARQVAADSGAVLLDCPLSGTSVQARSKDLAVYASGDEDAVRDCADVLHGFARAVHYLGAFGTGSKMKFLANLLVAVHNVAAAEAITLGKKAGLDPQVVYDVIASGGGTSRMFEVRGPMMVSGAYSTAGITGYVFQKDLEIIGSFARSVECPVPLFAASTQLYAAALALGLGDRDTASVCAVLERLAGLGGGNPAG